MEKLLNEGADPSAVDMDGLSVLYYVGDWGEGGEGEGGGRLDAKMAEVPCLALCKRELPGMQLRVIHSTKASNHSQKSHSLTLKARLLYGPPTLPSWSTWAPPSAIPISTWYGRCCSTLQAIQSGRADMVQSMVAQNAK